MGSLPRGVFCVRAVFNVLCVLCVLYYNTFDRKSQSRTRLRSRLLKVTFIRLIRKMQPGKQTGKQCVCIHKREKCLLWRPPIPRNFLRKATQKGRPESLPFSLYTGVCPIIIPRATRAINCLILSQPLPVIVSTIFSL